MHQHCNSSRVLSKLFSILHTRSYKALRIICRLRFGLQLLAFFTMKINLHFFLRNLSYMTVSFGFIVKYATFLLQSNGVSCITIIVSKNQCAIWIHPWGKYIAVSRKQVKHLLDGIMCDWGTLTNEEELRIIHEYSKVTRMLTTIYSCKLIFSVIQEGSLNSGTDENPSFWTNVQSCALLWRFTVLLRHATIDSMDCT